METLNGKYATGESGKNSGNRSFEVVEITYAQLFDRDAMAQHFYRIGRLLLGKETAKALRSDTVWFIDREAQDPSA